MPISRRACGLVLALFGAAVLAVALLNGTRDAPSVPAAGSVRSPVDVTLAGGTRSITGFPSRFAEHQSATARSTAPYVVALSNGASKVEALAAVRACGARVIGPLPPNAFLVETSVFALGKLSQDPHFVAATEFLPSDKVAPGFSGGWATVVALAEPDVETLAAFAREKGGELEPKGPRGKTSLVVRLTSALIGELAKRGEVRWIEPRPAMKLLNDYASVDTGVVATRNALGLTGAGQVIASADSGLDTGVLGTLHHDFTNRVLRLVNLGGYTTGDYNGHGTHTAGTIAGSGVMSGGQYRGVAPEVKLFIQCCGLKSESKAIVFNNAKTYDDIFTPGLASDAYIHSDSWGGVYEDEQKVEHYGYYDDFCSGLDRIVWENPELLVVLANGNDGSLGTMSVGSPASAKNCLSVGNARSSRTGGNPLNVSSSSSRGPCADGRIKPEISAPGSNIVSTRSSLSSCASYGGNASYTQMSGTSMATPHVAGCAALVREWLMTRQGYTNELPTAALLKAILTGGARSASLLPDNDRGWGLVDLDETLAPSNRAVRLIDRVPYDAGTRATYVFTLTNVAPFEVQLAWLDHPATLGAASALVNDLDLVVSNRATGAVWYGNGVEGGDRTNTVESVRFAEMPAGDYDVSVIGHDVLYRSTEGGAAALYVRGAFSATEDVWTDDEPEVEGRSPTVFVDAANGSDSTGDGSVRAPYATISAALSAAEDGDAVLVRPGTYASVSIPSGKTVEIVSTAGPSATVIDGRGVGRCYNGFANPSTVLRGFTLVNGSAPRESYYSSTTYGGGAYGGTLVGCAISNCLATIGGGAYYAVLENCLVVSNLASSSSRRTEALGGGAYCCELYNCTVVGNRAVGTQTTSYGGGAFVYPEGCAYNTVFYGNVADLCPDYYGYSESLAKCLIDEDPKFADPARGDYRLTAASPALDAGYDACSQEDFDLAGNARIRGSAIDLGCYEYQQTVAFGARTVHCSQAAQERTIGVFAAGAWTLSSDAGWVTVSAAAGEDGAEVACSLARNETGAARQATLTLRSAEDGMTATLSVWQAGASAEKGGTRYGLFVGVDEYDAEYVAEEKWLAGTVADALSLYERSLASRLMMPENATVLTNAWATKAAIRAKLTELAGVVRSGDVVVYAHSGHGWNYTDSPKETGLCAYDDDYSDVELAEDLARFPADVRVIAVIDTCHSGGLFKAPGSLYALSSLVARGTLSALQTLRRPTFGTRAENPSAVDYDVDGNIAFLTAADYNQYSWGESEGGAFTIALTQGWASGAAETDGNGRLDFRELYDYAAERAVGDRTSGPADWTEAQCFNEPLLLTTLAELTDAQWTDPGIEEGDAPEVVSNKVQTALTNQGVAAEKAAAVTDGEQYDALAWWLEAMNVPISSFNASPSALVSAALCADALLPLESDDVRLSDLTIGTNETGRLAVTMKLSLKDYDRMRVSPALLKAAVGVVGSDTPCGSYSSKDLNVSVAPVADGVELTATPPEGRPAYFLKGVVR